MACSCMPAPMPALRHLSINALLQMAVKAKVH